MTPLDPNAARAAKAALAERLTAIGASYVPEGWTVAYRKSLSGRCYHSRNHIDAPRPVTRKSLYIFLHECAHAILHHAAPGKNKPSHVKEHEAETWAHATMREHGVAVPRVMTTEAKAYVRRKIRRAIRNGAKTIDPAAAKFAWRK